MLLLLIAVGLLHIIAGYITARALRPVNRTEHLLSAGLIAYVTFHVIPVGLGWATGYMNLYVLAAGLAVALFAATATWLKTKSLVIPRSTPLFRGRCWIEFLVWGFTAILLLLLLCSGMAYPARTYDALQYHMSNPIRWHMTGRFILDSFGAVDLAPQRISAESAPNLKAVWPFAVMVFTKGIAGTALAQFPFLLILLAAVRSIALRIGARPWLASLAALASISVPELFLQSITDYSDLMFLSGQMVIVWSLLYLWQETFNWRSILYPVLSLGLLAGAKAIFAVPAAALGAVCGVLLLWRGWRARGWRCSYYAVGGLILAVLMMTVCAGPWLIHSWKKYDNPVFPYEVKIGETVLFEGTYPGDLNRAMVKQFTQVDDPAKAYWNTLREVWRPISFSSWSSGLGMGMFVIGLPSLLLFALAGLWPREKRGARLIFVILFGVLMLTCPMLAVARFSLFQPVMGFIAFAWLASLFPVFMRIVAVLVLLNTVAYDLIMVLPSIQHRQRPTALIAFNLLSGFPRAAQTDTYPDQYTALDFWREEVSGPGTKLALPPADVGVWQAYAPWSPGDLLRCRSLRSFNDVEKWTTELRDAGITHIYMRATDRTFKLMFLFPDKFHLLFRRLDTHFLSYYDGIPVEHWPEDALFELAGEKVTP